MFKQSDHSIHCLLTDSLDIAEYIYEQKTCMQCAGWLGEQNI